AGVAENGVMLIRPAHLRPGARPPRWRGGVGGLRRMTMKGVHSMAIGAVALAAVFATGCGQTGGAASGGAVTAAAPDPANATFTIEKDTITLTNGRSERPSAPGSSSSAMTTLDQRTSGDVDGDGRADSVVILVNQPGGSGTFYYVGVLLNASGGTSATPALLLGDRVKVNDVRIDGKTIVVELLDRAPGQPMIASPSVSVTKRFSVDGGALKGE
ncbi:MAG TPA: hypothetical protein VFV20_01450, partial [Candidatus Limnocylindria bacterium]|nr:hypothetical protein [Candidatus Limnocylindria bacterium]